MLANIRARIFSKVSRKHSDIGDNQVHDFARNNSGIDAHKKPCRNNTKFIPTKKYSAFVFNGRSTNDDNGTDNKSIKSENISIKHNILPRLTPLCISENNSIQQTNKRNDSHLDFYYSAPFDIKNGLNDVSNVTNEKNKSSVYNTEQKMIIQREIDTVICSLCYVYGTRGELFKMNQLLKARHKYSLFDMGWHNEILRHICNDIVIAQDLIAYLECTENGDTPFLTNELKNIVMHTDDK